MIKIWKGIEKEGIGKESEVCTLFISADEVLSYPHILPYLKQNLDIQAVYLGAGRVPFCAMLFYESFVAYCLDHDIRIVIEALPEDFIILYKRYNAPNVLFVVSYYNVPKDATNVYFKTDDLITTRIFTQAKAVDITDVIDNRYPDDEILYEED